MISVSPTNPNPNPNPSVMLVPNTSATISLFVYCDDNTLEQKIFILVEKAYDDYINDEYLYNYIDKNIEQIFINN